MKRYKILDNESTRDFAEGLIGKEFYGEKSIKYIRLYIDCGELLFASDEVEELN